MYSLHFIVFEQDNTLAKHHELDLLVIVWQNLKSPGNHLSDQLLPFDCALQD